MADTFLLEIVTPYKKLLSKEVSEMTAPGQEGEFGVLVGHTPFLTILRAGEISYKSGSEAGSIAVGRGYAEVLPGKTTVLVDRAAVASEIDVDKARAQLSSAEEELKGLSAEDPAYEKASDNAGFAEAQIRVKEKGR